MMPAGMVSPTLPVDVRLSQYKCIPEQGAIRLGLNYVKGFGEAAAERVIEARQVESLS